jgi:diguanylate cyclase (GGDEF)-like protein/PAS domain S-box-containing protein
MTDLLRAKRLIWGVIFLLLTGVACLSYFSGTRYVAAVRAVDQALAVQSAINGALSLVKDAETGQRGFILTGDEQFLEPYEAALSGIPRHLEELALLTHADAAQTERRLRAEVLAHEKLAFIENAIRLRRDNDLEGAMVLVRSGRGKQLMDSLRFACGEMSKHEQKTLATRRGEAESAKNAALWGVGVGSLVSVLLALLSLITVDRDLKTLRRTAEELAASEAHFRLLTENTSDLVRLLDLNGKATYVSPSVERLLGYGVEEYMALPAKSLMHPDELATAASILSDVKSGAKTSDVSTYRLRNKNGLYRFFEVRWSVQRNAAGEATSIHTVGRDVTERKLADEMLSAQAEDLRSLSLRDELTGLYNRRGFLEIAGQAQAQAARDRRPAALIFVDLNGMKRINDELGHDAGDDALKDAACVLKEALTRSDVVARLGGDEFVAFSLDFISGNLEPLRRRLRSLADEEVARKHRPYRLSMSSGAAYTDAQTPESLAELLERADAAMYEQKRARKAAGGISMIPPAERG